jgi:hypothetical protein
LSVRVLLDEMLPRRLAGEIAGHDVSTVVREGWASLKNGELLDAIGTHFDVFITMDRNMRFQQRLAGRPFAVIEVHGLSTSIRALLPLVPELIRCIDSIKPGEIQIVGEPRHEESRQEG